jgi:hypothetical protein
MMIAMLHGPFEVFAHERAFGEDAGEREREEDGEPAVDREAGIEMDRVRRSRAEARPSRGASFRSIMALRSSMLWAA